MRFEQPLPLALPVAFTLNFPLVVEFLAPHQAELDFGPALFPIEPEGNQGEAAAFDRPGQFVEFAAVKEELPCAFGVRGAVGRSREQRRDMAAEEPRGAIFDDRVSFPDLTAPGTQGFDLPAFEDESRLEPLLDEIFETSPAVLGDRRGG